MTSSASFEPPSKISTRATRVWDRNLMHKRCCKRQCLGKIPSKRRSTPRRRRRNQANRLSIWSNWAWVDLWGKSGSYGCICWLQNDSICTAKPTQENVVSLRMELLKMWTKTANRQNKTKTVTCCWRACPPRASTTRHASWRERNWPGLSASLWKPSGLAVELASWPTWLKAWDVCSTNSFFIPVTVSRRSAIRGT